MVVLGRIPSLRGFDDACLSASGPGGQTLVSGRVSRRLRHRSRRPPPGAGGDTLPPPLPLLPQPRVASFIVIKTATQRGPF